jgi:hypothetical protein
MLDTYAQWLKRPDDQRFLDIASLYEAVKSRRQRSTQVDGSLEHLQFVTDHQNVFIRNQETEQEAELTNWSFGQAASLLKFPAKALRDLDHPQLACAVLQQKVFQQERQDMRFLQTAEEDGLQMRAINSCKYGRIWDEHIVRLIMEHIDLDTWKVPSASYASRNPTRASTLYASDRDVYVWLVDEANPIEVPGSNGKDTMFRGFKVSNSETGAGTFHGCEFTYRSSCDNRLLYGVTMGTEVKLRHTSGAPSRFKYEFIPKMKQAISSDPRQYVDAVEAARLYEVGKSDKDAVKWLSSKSGFTATLSKRVLAKAEEEDEDNPRSLWGLINGATAMARDLKHQDSRVELETKASDLMKYAVARV